MNAKKIRRVRTRKCICIFANLSRRESSKKKSSSNRQCTPKLQLLHCCIERESENVRLCVCLCVQRKKQMCMRRIEERDYVRGGG